MKEKLVEVLKATLVMEWYGIRIEKTTEVGETTYYYVSVPESSTIVVEDQELNSKIKTSDGLASLAKDMLVKIQIDSCKLIDDDEDFIQYVKDNMSNIIKVYARVRKGEVWTKDMAEARIKEQTEEIKKVDQYQEV